MVIRTIASEDLADKLNSAFFSCNITGFVFHVCCWIFQVCAYDLSAIEKGPVFRIPVTAIVPLRFVFSLYSSYVFLLRPPECQMSPLNV